MDPAVCLRLALRCWLKKGTFTVRIIIGKSKTAASEIYATGYGARKSRRHSPVNQVKFRQRSKLCRGLFRSMNPLKQIDLENKHKI
jgi:hypothetical protein